MPQPWEGLQFDRLALVAGKGGLDHKDYVPDRVVLQLLVARATAFLLAARAEIKVLAEQPRHKKGAIDPDDALLVLVDLLAVVLVLQVVVEFLQRLGDQGHIFGLLNAAAQAFDSSFDDGQGRRCDHQLDQGGFQVFQHFGAQFLAERYRPGQDLGGVINHIERVLDLLLGALC